MSETPSRTRWLIGIVIALLAAGGGIVALVDYFDRPKPRMADLEIAIDRYAGGDYRDFYVPSVQECSNSCLKDPKCMSFSFNVSSNQCWLKNDVPLRFENKGFISGVKFLE